MDCNDLRSCSTYIYAELGSDVSGATYEYVWHFNKVPGLIFALVRRKPVQVRNEMEEWESKRWRGLNQIEICSASWKCDRRAYHRSNIFLIEKDHRAFSFTISCIIKSIQEVETQSVQKWLFSEKL
ncbi:hypothetical protein SUGI_0666110 [Cryptomeria japonica]|nr:hypothetical protein SUGI_0666110 [Cryptomeria japonica]